MLVAEARSMREDAEAVALLCCLDDQLVHVRTSTSETLTRSPQLREEGRLVHEQEHKWAWPSVKNLTLRVSEPHARTSLSVRRPPPRCGEEGSRTYDSIHASTSSRRSRKPPGGLKARSLPSPMARRMVFSETRVYATTSLTVSKGAGDPDRTSPCCTATSPSSTRLAPTGS